MKNNDCCLIDHDHLLENIAETDNEVDDDEDTP